jgi:hypothetical protein
MTLVKLEVMPNPTPYDDDELLTTAEVMAKLKIRSRVTLAAYKRAGMPYHQLHSKARPRFRWSEVQAWINSRCITPTPASGPDEEPAA